MVVRAPILATKPMVSDKALAVQLCRQRILTKTESRETRKVFIGREEYSTVYGQTQRETVTKSHPCGRLNHLHGAFRLGFFFCLFGLLICLIQSPYLIYLRILPCVCKHLLEKMDSTKEAYE